jgi:hypothetical protein
MVETKMLVNATNKVGTEVYYLGNFGRQSIARYNLPNVDSRPEQYQASINIQTDNGHRVINKRQATARTSINNKRQESSTEKKSSVTPSATKKARTDSKPEHKFEKDADYSSDDDKSEQSKDIPPSDEESGKSDHSAFRNISIHDLMNPDHTDEEYRSV